MPLSEIKQFLDYTRTAFGEETIEIIFTLAEGQPRTLELAKSFRDKAIEMRDAKRDVELLEDTKYGNGKIILPTGHLSIHAEALGRWF